MKYTSKIPLNERLSIDEGLADLQRVMSMWQLNNFPDATPDDPFTGMVEELGELAHARLKMKQGIRTDEDHEAAERDALGDILIFMTHYATLRKIRLSDAVLEAMEVVLKREWT